MNKIELENNGIGLHLNPAWMSEKERVLKRALKECGLKKRALKRKSEASFLLLYVK
jgi:hypothetical protein